jgi:hypothetical protein
MRYSLCTTCCLEKYKYLYSVQFHNIYISKTTFNLHHQSLWSFPLRKIWTCIKTQTFNQKDLPQWFLFICRSCTRLGSLHWHDKGTEFSDKPGESVSVILLSVSGSCDWRTVANRKWQYGTYEVWGSHSGAGKDARLLGCDALWVGMCVCCTHLQRSPYPEHWCSKSPDVICQRTPFFFLEPPWKQKHASPLKLW